MPSAIAASHRAARATQRPPIDRVKEHLRDRTALLVLDNFEQVVAGAPVVADLLRSAPKLTVIVSSRAPLRISGEQEFPVPPLSLPPAGRHRPRRRSSASEAVRLFVERAMAVRPDFALTAENGRHVAEIVRRLDGLPLAIELAAARIRLLSPAAMAQRLGDRLGLLSAGGRDLPERQRTLRGAIDWSHDLLDPEDRRLFARLGVFAGGGPLETAGVRVRDPRRRRVSLDVVDGLERLAEQSLVRIGDDLHGDVRFTMLETIREYALDKLGERGETDALRDRHAEAFARVRGGAATDGARHDRGGGRTGSAARPARGRARQPPGRVRAPDRRPATPSGAADLVFALWRFWHMRGHITEGAVPRRPGAGDAAVDRRSRRGPGCGRSRRPAASPTGAATWSRRARTTRAAVEVARALGDEAEIANALYNLFFARRPASDSDEWFDVMRG